MSDKISLAQFEQEIKETLLPEVQAINKRKAELERLFLSKANQIQTQDEEERGSFQDAVLELASHFIDNIDYEYSTVEEGKVQIWEQSTC